MCVARSWCGGGGGGVKSAVEGEGIKAFLP